MAQTGVPFGEIDAVREWLEIEAPVGRPGAEHPKRPVTGFGCSRREVSGKRVWALMQERFGTPVRFFDEHFIANYCPLLFFDQEGKNITPDKLIKEDREELYRLCDAHAAELIEIFSPRFVIGFGKFAGSRLDAAVASDTDINVFSILHPSPANPRANKGWAEQVSAELESAGVW
jgi:single-strand selective monofunctional uracil DNA glycosylase